jgi:hypothetical protein
MSGSQLKIAAQDEPGAFAARTFKVWSSPDADGDVIADDNNGRQVKVSLADHDSFRDPALEPAGTAVLRRVGDSVHAIGRAYDSPRGKQLRDLLVTRGPGLQWSVGYRVLEFRAPSSKELATWPDARRVIEKWDVFEVSPVGSGACGPTCRTLAAKCQGGCGCGGTLPDPEFEKLVAQHRALGEALSRGALPEEQDAAILVEMSRLVEREADMRARGWLR